ncbi:MAG: site-specific integrase, partial [Nitrososphaeria archaeon]
MALPKNTNGNLPINLTKKTINYLTPDQLNSLTQAFTIFYDKANRYRKSKGKYWLVFLFLRYSGARLGEVLNIDDITDIDYRNNEIKLITLKQRQRVFRIVPMPPEIISQVAVYTSQYPQMRGRVFKSVFGSAFRRTFFKISISAGIPKELSHPHILRHTRAIELLRAGVPITAVQDLLG